MEQRKGKMVLASYKERMVLPFEPLVFSFNDVNYFIDVPHKMGSERIIEKKLFCDVTGAIRPHVLTALMGVSGAGKTTLLDVLSGRKTIGRIEVDIRVGGHPKDQETFCRIDQQDKMMILMKKGGQIIYFGQIGQQSKNVISYFESILGVTY
ncbi:hypothetical protein MRB53_035570 [Persea americana]|uniref:Uncharacterized protein n=1 Tax=Persea americana TaxID=3435 RepID=A0ACC2K5M8_PERAE|nr:hypothetical protein MRB53_035570 [Persea americana]